MISNEMRGGGSGSVRQHVRLHAMPSYQQGWPIYTFSSGMVNGIKVQLFFNLLPQWYNVRKILT
jgi:hypothetical protein